MKTESYPPSQRAYDALKQDGLLKYGQEIDWQTMESATGLSRDSIEFVGAMIELDHRLKEEHQFFLTERGMRGRGKRIAHREEMAEMQAAKLRQQRNQNARNARAMSLVDVSGFTEVQLMRHERVTAQTGLAALVLDRISRKRALPGPQCSDPLRSLLR